MFTKIELFNTLYAVVIPFDTQFSGVEFITDKYQEFQIGMMKRNGLNNVPKHRHLNQKREIFKTSESLIILEGSLTISLWTNDNIFIKEIKIEKPSLVTLFTGYHKIRFNSETKLIEIKQGPYSASKDKIYE